MDFNNQCDLIQGTWLSVLSGFPRDEDFPEGRSQDDAHPMYATCQFFEGGRCTISSEKADHSDIHGHWKPTSAQAVDEFRVTVMYQYRRVPGTKRCLDESGSSTQVAIGIAVVKLEGDSLKGTFTWARSKDFTTENVAEASRALRCFAEGGEIDPEKYIKSEGAYDAYRVMCMADHEKWKAIEKFARRKPKH